MDIATIFKKHIPEYLNKFGKKIPYNHLKTINDILQCRTAELGGEIYYCEKCKKFHYSYHSCKNRHCPKCGSKDSAKWFTKQKEKLLPVDYFIVTFTLPEEFRNVCRSNQRIFYSALFKASSLALLRMLKDPTYAGGEAGFVGVLHTWTRQLIFHPHGHFIVPSGAFDFINNIWKKSAHEYLVPVKLLSKKYRKIFEKIIKTDAPKLYNSVPSDTWEKAFITNSTLVEKGEAAFKYLANYVYKTAISNNRIISCSNGKVTFSYKDSQSGEHKLCSVEAMEFIRRFLQHTLPAGFQKVRYYGFVSSASKSKLEKVKLYWNIKPEKSEKKDTSNVKPKEILCCHCSSKLILCGSIPRRKRAPPELLLQKYAPRYAQQINA